MSTKFPRGEGYDNLAGSLYGFEGLLPDALNIYVKIDHYIENV